ncbi:MAG: response regulator [bacterium]|nr:response regulator [bacterium]
MADQKVKVKLLLVDDDEFLLDMYSLKFKEAGYNIDVATSGQDALDKLGKDSYDVILLDVVMPTLDGFEVLTRIRKDKLAEGAIVIILSNLGQKEDIERGMELGASDYIVKAHFTPREVVEKIEFHLSKKDKKE